MGDAAGRGWGRGWPTDRSTDMVDVRAGGIVVAVHHRLAPLVDWLLDETARRGYLLRAGECWGYANRPIRGAKKPSNHSWGLAVDLNAPANPMSDKLITDMPSWMPQLWADHGFEWGGNYRGRKDAMHYEFAGRPADVDRYLTAAPTPIGDDDMQKALKTVRVDGQGPEIAILDKGTVTIGSPGQKNSLIDLGLVTAGAPVPMSKAEFDVTLAALRRQS